VDEAPKRLRLRRAHLTVTYVAFLRKRKEFIDAWKKWFNSKMKHGFSSVPLRRTLGCESWLSSAAAATRSRSESSPIHDSPALLPDRAV
jgi:hypothetical protein